VAIRDVLRALDKLRKDMTMDERGRNYYDENGDRIDYSRPGAGYHKDLEEMYREEVSSLARSHTRPQLDAELANVRAELSDDMSPYGFKEWQARITKLQEARRLQDSWGL
jgi:hypothetical protein